MPMINNAPAELDAEPTLTTTYDDEFEASIEEVFYRMKGMQLYYDMKNCRPKDEIEKTREFDEFVLNHARKVFERADKLHGG